MMMIRQYDDSDSTTIKALHQLVLENAGAFAPGPWDTDLDDVSKVYLKSGGDFLVAECDGVIVGMGAIRRTDNTKAEIKRMRVHPDYQRKGIGTAILGKLEARALELGYTLLQLDTTTLQLAAQAFYEKHGYTRTGTSRFLEFDLILFEKLL